MRSVFSFLIFFLIGFSAFPVTGPVFSISDLSPDEKLLFTVTVDQPVTGPVKSLFTAYLEENDRIEAHTFFPEISRYFPESAELEFQNHFGLYRFFLKNSSGFRELGFLPSFSGGENPENGKILPVSSSPDGKWVLRQEADGPVKGRLILSSSTGSGELLISSDQVLSFRDAPAIWSPDSRYLLYSKNGKIYYVSTIQIENGRIPDESYRCVGSGKLSNVKLTSHDSLYYICGRALYLLRPSQLFTKSFYSEPLVSGTVAGTIPITFDNDFDTYWPSPDGKSVFLLKGERNLFYFPLKQEERTENLPSMHLSPQMPVKKIWWDSGTRVFLSIGEALYSLDTESGESFKRLDVSGIRNFVPSENHQLMALLLKDGVSIRSVKTMEELNFIPIEKPLNLFWVDDAHIVITGFYRTDLVKTDGTERKLIALSQIERAAFTDKGSIRALCGGEEYLWNPVERQWKPDSAEEELNSPSFKSPEHRVFLSDNSIVVRSVAGFGNRILFESRKPENYGSTVEGEESGGNEDWLVTHGSRTRGRKVSLVFNAIDNDDGLGDVLSLLEDYNLKLTFFFSGDFICRNPASTRFIVESGHESASLFYAPIELSDFRYRIDKDFLVKGLGRNEDIFFEETGHEISTLWHAPWYIISPPIEAATKEMNYLYIGRDVDPLDWVVQSNSSGNEELYKSASELVQMVLDKVKPGSIIPVRIGRPGEREDYMFQFLDLLINGLLNDGYEIVSVSELCELEN